MWSRSRSWFAALLFLSGFAWFPPAPMAAAETHWDYVEIGVAGETVVSDDGTYCKYPTDFPITAGAEVRLRTEVGGEASVATLSSVIAETYNPGSKGPGDACALWAQVDAVPMSDVYLIEIGASPGRQTDSSISELVVLVEFWTRNFSQDVEADGRPTCAPNADNAARPGQEVRFDPAPLGDATPVLRGIPGVPSGTACKVTIAQSLPPTDGVALTIGEISATGSGQAGTKAAVWDDVLIGVSGGYMVGPFAAYGPTCVPPDDAPLSIGTDVRIRSSAGGTPAFGTLDGLVEEFYGVGKKRAGDPCVLWTRFADIAMSDGYLIEIGASPAGNNVSSSVDELAFFALFRTSEFTAIVSPDGTTTCEPTTDNAAMPGARYKSDPARLGSVEPISIAETFGSSCRVTFAGQFPSTDGIAIAIGDMALPTERAAIDPEHVWDTLEVGVGGSLTVNQNGTSCEVPDGYPIAANSEVRIWTTEESGPRIFHLSDTATITTESGPKSPGDRCTLFLSVQDVPMSDGYRIEIGDEPNSSAESAFAGEVVAYVNFWTSDYTPRTMPDGATTCTANADTVPRPGYSFRTNVPGRALVGGGAPFVVGQVFAPDCRLSVGAVFAPATGYAFAIGDMHLRKFTPGAPTAAWSVVEVGLAGETVVGSDGRTCVTPSGFPMGPGTEVRLRLEADGEAARAFASDDIAEFYNEAAMSPGDECALWARFRDVPLSDGYLVEIGPAPDGHAGPASLRDMFVIVEFWTFEFDVRTQPNGEEACEATTANGAEPDGHFLTSPAPRGRGGPPITGVVLGRECRVGLITLLPPADAYAVAVGNVPLPDMAHAGPMLFAPQEGTERSS